MQERKMYEFITFFPLSFSLKMTGLDIDKDQIIEMACIVTDAELNILAEVR